MEYSISTHKETERYKAILQAAERLFVEKGYHGVSIEQIANAAGVSKGLVHYHYVNKEQLIVYVVEDVLAKLSTSLDDILKSNETSQTKIRIAIKTYLNLANPRLNLARTLLFENVLTENMSKYLASLMEENTLKLAGLVDDGITKGEFKPVNSRLVANLIRGAIFELIGEAAIQQREMRSLDELADGITEILCDGINR
ncbi:TetR family transcriptional regulator [Chloroflexota bacterium]